MSPRRFPPGAFFMLENGPKETLNCFVSFNGTKPSLSRLFSDNLLRKSAESAGEDSPQNAQIGADFWQVNVNSHFTISFV